MSVPMNSVIAALEARDCRPKRNGKGWSARCPAHEDHSPSLSVAEGDDGRCLVHCHAGCGADAVARALGLDMTLLFADKPSAWRRTKNYSLDSTPKKTTTAKSEKSKPPKTFKTWQEAAAAGGLGGTATSWWEYHDRDSRLVGIIARRDHESEKVIRPVSTVPGGGWVAQAMPAPRPIYNLPNVISADRVVVVEGEKCADALVSLGIAATTSSQGAKSADKADWSPLAGKQVVILPDHDEAGAQYAADVARLAAEAGAKSVSLVRLADQWRDCPAGGDVADYVASFGDVAEPADILAVLEAIIAKAEPAAAMLMAEPAVEDDDVAWTPFPTNELPEPIASFVREGAAAIGADESMVALPMLAMLAGAIGNLRRLRIKPDWSIPPVLWTAVVSESGSGKSPSLRIASGFTNDAQGKAFRRHEEDMAEYEMAMANYELQLKDRAKRGGVAPEKPRKPAARRFVANDTTVEALVPILQNNPRGVVVAVDELAGWFGSHDAYRPGGRGGVDRPKWLSMFDAGPVTVDRKTSGTVHVPSAAVSITGGVQPSILRSLLTPDAVTSGLVSRFIFTMPPRRRMRWSDEAISFALKAEVTDLFTLLLDGLRDEIIADEGPEELDLDPEAKEEFSRFAEDVYSRQADASGAAAAMLSKLTSTAGRLALVIHVVRQAGREPTLGDRVGVESVRRGIALALWAEREQRRIYSLLLPDRGVDQAADDASRLGHWLANREGGYASDRDIRHGLARFRDDEARAKAAVARLVAEGRAIRETIATGGRPSKIVRVVGNAFGAFGSGAA